MNKFQIVLIVLEFTSKTFYLVGFSNSSETLTKMIKLSVFPKKMMNVIFCSLVWWRQKKQGVELTILLELLHPDFFEHIFLCN